MPASTRTSARFSSLTWGPCCARRWPDREEALSGCGRGLRVPGRGWARLCQRGAQRLGFRGEDTRSVYEIARIGRVRAGKDRRGGGRLLLGITEPAALAVPALTIEDQVADFLGIRDTGAAVGIKSSPRFPTASRRKSPIPPSRWQLATGPHTTRRAGPHRAVSQATRFARGSLLTLEGAASKRFKSTVFGTKLRSTVYTMFTPS